MLAQWKSDGLIARKCLDRNEDMYDFFGHIAILSSGRIKLFLGSSVLYQSMLAQWKSDGLITRKCLIKRGHVLTYCQPSVHPSPKVWGEWYNDVAKPISTQCVGQVELSETYL